MKTEKPWRLNDARFCDINNNNKFYSSDSIASIAKAKILALHANRRFNNNNTILNQKPQSTSLVAIQQRKFQENSEQSFQTDLQNQVVIQILFFTFNL